MMRRIVLFATACLLLIGLSLFGCDTTSGPVVTFPDPNLERAIREKANKPSGPIYASDIAVLPSLSAYDRGIEDLAGIQHCTSLTALNLVDNQISDISALADLTNLTVLYLGVNQISDISPLDRLTNLTFLYLAVNQINDISALADLTNLASLHLESNKITEISPLVENAGLSEGDFVYLDGNPLNSASINVYVPQLEARGVTITY